VTSATASNNRSLLRRVLALGAVLVAAVAAAVWIGELRRPENIILIVIDTLRADTLGCYGGKAATPRMDALAASGLRLDPVVGSFHQTSASMGAMFTGLTPSLEDAQGGVLPWNGRTWCGMYRFGTGDAASECLPTSLPTLPERMKKGGYRTIGVVSNNLLFRPAGFDRGFDVWTEIGSVAAKPENQSIPDYARQTAASRNSSHVIPAALDAVRAHASEQLFVYLHFMDVHDWYTPGEPSNSARRVHNYPLAVERMDTRLGVLLDGLEEMGVLEHSTVVLVADHGEALGEPHPIEAGPTHEANPAYETVARIPLIVAPAKGRALPASMHAERPLTRTQDVYGLVLMLAGVEGAAPPTPLEADEYFYTELFYRTLRRGSLKVTCSRGAAAPVRCAMFDLAADPHEEVDVSKAEPGKFAGLVARMTDLASQLGADPIPAGEMSQKDRERLQALGYLQ